MLKNCSNCDHCFAKMNGNIFCELDGMAIKNPYEEVDCEYHTNVTNHKNDIEDKFCEILEDLTNLYEKISYLKDDVIGERPPEDEEVELEIKDENEDVVASIISKLLM